MDTFQHVSALLNRREIYEVNAHISSITIFYFATWTDFNHTGPQPLLMKALYIPSMNCYNNFNQRKKKYHLVLKLLVLSKRK